MNETVFQVAGSDMFDSTGHTQGGLPHLMQHLWDAYVEHLKTAIETRKSEGKTVVDLETAKKKAPATDFAVFATNYLKEHRVSESFFIDANHGIRLGNNVMVAVCPGVEIKGTMQDAGAVEVTHGRSQPHQQGIVGQSGDIRI
jgi:hypothetical protein